MTTTRPPDQRLDGPIHDWFGLSYSNYQVLPRTLMQSMPGEWQQRMVACLEELRAAYAHIEHPDSYGVIAAKERHYGELTTGRGTGRSTTVVCCSGSTPASFGSRPTCGAATSRPIRGTTC